MAASGDIDAIARLEQECMPSPWSRNSVAEELLSNESSRFFVAVDGESRKIVGYAGSWVVPPFECQIGNVAVSPDFRRQGVATKLLRALSDAAAEEGIKDITLEVRPSNKAAIALYEGLGFRREGLRKKYYDDLEDAIIMWRRGK
jgi:ribosomal-protein-alanine N-acetyltransferase